MADNVMIKQKYDVDEIMKKVAIISSLTCDLARGGGYSRHAQDAVRKELVSRQTELSEIISELIGYM